MKRIVTLAVIGVFIGLVLVVAIGCGSGSVTGPSDEGVSQGSVGTPTQKADPVPAPSPTPQPADAAATEPYVEFAADGSGRFCNPKTHVGSVTITYTKELDLREIYGTPRTYHAEPGKCVQIPPTISVIMPDILPTLKCGTTWKKRVQQDANNGEISLAGKHLGHVFVDVEFSAEACCVESEETKTEVSYGEWGECKPANGEANQSTVTPECRKARTKTTTTTTTFAQCQKKEPVVKIETTTEYEKCECPCLVSGPRIISKDFDKQDRDSRWNHTDWWVVGTAVVEGAGNWEVRIIAEELDWRGNVEERWEKVKKVKTLTCNDYPYTFNVEYHSEGHSADKWYMEIYLNGVKQYTSPSEINASRVNEQ